MNPNETLESIRAYVAESLLSGVDPEVLRNQILGRRGRLTEVLRSLSGLPIEERTKLGAAANVLKVELIENLGQVIPNQRSNRIDATVPPSPMPFGSIHPISAMIEEMTGIFADLSFEIVEGNELVTDEENFENLNITKDHPARDGQDSFYVSDTLVMRTQTTAVQVLEMTRRLKEDRLPIRVVVPGKTYRRESDQTHSAMFHQMDAVMVDDRTTFADLKGCLDYFAKRLFGDLVETRFRPHYFPFTEPSAEMDIRWKGETRGEGKHTGWLEFGGCGMIHPDVLKRAGLNPRIYQGWAFGMSIERPIMLRYQLPDLRRLYENSAHLLNQFPESI